MTKRNDGFTLVELIVSIAISTIITAGVLSILLFGMRINAKTADNVKQQNATNMITQIVQTVAEEPNVAIHNNTIVLLKLDENGEIYINSNGNFEIYRVLVKCDGKNILLNNTVFMENVSNIVVSMNDNNLLTMQIWMFENDINNPPDYTTSAYCRLYTPSTPIEGGATQ